MIFGRRKPGFTQAPVGDTPDEIIENLQKAELAAKKPPKDEVFDLDAAIEKVHRMQQKGSSMDGANLKEDAVIETSAPPMEAPAEMSDASSAAGQDKALLDYLTDLPESDENFDDIPASAKAEEPEPTEAQKLASYIRSRSAAAQLTPYSLLKEEVEECDTRLSEIEADPDCSDIVFRQGEKDKYYYSDVNMSTNYAMIATFIADDNLCATIAEMVRFNAKTYPTATPIYYFTRKPYNYTREQIDAAWEQIQSNEMFQDIEQLVNNEGTKFFFSTKHLTRRYATAISNVDEFCD